MLKHILVTLDGSELAETALRYAREILAPNGKITLLSVLEFTDVNIPMMYDMPILATKDYSQMTATAETGANEYLKRIAEQLQTDYGLTANYVITSGNAAADIIHEAKTHQVDAIVMSTHGRSGITRWLLGSVTQKVLSAMPCPVFVIPGTQHIAPESDAGKPESAS